MQNHADFARKLLLRSSVAGAMRPRFVADCFAGDGALTAALWAGIADRVLCIERNPECRPALDALAARHGTIDVVIARNQTQIQRIIAADVVDCDAYGLALPFIESLIAAGLRAGTLVFFTDGTHAGKSAASEKRTACIRRNSRTPVHDPSCRKITGGLALYGYGVTA